MTNARDKEMPEKKGDFWGEKIGERGPAQGCQRTFSTRQFSVIFLQKQFANAQKKRHGKYKEKSRNSHKNFAEKISVWQGWQGKPSRI